ncbi:MAG TPA: hypothetical protein VHV57_05465 [Acidimicrobiales bacterium]|nr:hypothetical protein [Acidimicrobiales bacterium]
MTEVDVPSEFWGLWRRHSVALDGAPAIEPALVFWCQAPRLFMDMRWCIDPVEANGLGLSVDRMMAGFTTYEEAGFMTWHHDVDSLIGAGSDRSAVRVTGDELIEEGSIPTPDGPPLAFVEVWRRVCSDTPVITQNSTDSGQVFTASIGPWLMELTVPEGRASLTCRSDTDSDSEVSWSLGGSFAAAGGN